MSEEIISISHETIGSNLLLYPLLRKLRVSEIIDRHCSSYAEISPGVVAETIILSRFSKKRIPMYQLQQFCKDNGIGTIYCLDTEKINDDPVRDLDCNLFGIEYSKSL